MFANPDWFNSKSNHFFPAPLQMRGWIFYLVSIAILFLPTILLVMRNQVVPEALIWVGVFSIGFLVEIRGVSKGLRKREARKSMYHISDDEDVVQTPQ